MGALLRPPLAALFFLCSLVSLIPSGWRPEGAAAAETPAYVALGDSLAFGVGAPGPRHGGYVALVHNALQRSDRYRERGLELVNFAVPGATSADLLLPGGQLESALEEIRSRQEDTSSADDNVEIISVNIGGNDLLALATPSSPCFEDVAGEECRDRFGETLASFNNNLRQVLTKLRKAAPRAGIYVLDLYNPYSGTGDEREPVADLAVQNLNGIVGAIAADDELNVRLASVFQLFRGRGLQWIAADGIHPNENGHKVMAEVLLAAIDNREPIIPGELLDQTPAPAATPSSELRGLVEGNGSGDGWLLWLMVPAAFAAGALVAGAYFWARGRS